MEYQIYYYKDLLSPSEEAEPLFTQFSVANYTAIADKVNGTDGHITVLAQAVQADNVDVEPEGQNGLIEKRNINGVYFIVNWSDDIAKFKGVN